MEKMERSLGVADMKNVDLQQSNLIVVDIMFQIASGMFYLHDMNVAHRDLKPDNILVNSLNDPILDSMGYVKVKLVDFGISKIEAQDAYEEPTGLNLGTTGFRAPETFVGYDDPLKHHVNAFKSDVFSFAMVCSYILTRVIPFSQCMRSKVKESMQAGERPSLPPDCPESLTSLIKDCWTFEPSERPTFQDICSRLRQIRHELHLNDVHILNNGVKIDKSNMPQTQETSENIRPIIHFVEHKGDTSAKNGGNELVGMQERIGRVLEALERHSIVAIVGVGGMGKTTLAKCMIERMGDDFEAFCFTFMKNKNCGAIEIFKETLNNLGARVDELKDIVQARTRLCDTINNKMHSLCLTTLAIVHKFMN